jgi:hypothetical protein
LGGSRRKAGATREAPGTCLASRPNRPRPRPRRRPRLRMEGFTKDGRGTNGESNLRELRSYHPENSRGRPRRRGREGLRHDTKQIKPRFGRSLTPTFPRRLAYDVIPIELVNQLTRRSMRGSCREAGQPGTPRFGRRSLTSPNAAALAAGEKQYGWFQSNLKSPIPAQKTPANKF